MTHATGSWKTFRHTSKNTVLLILIVATATLAISTIVSVWLSRSANLRFPSLGTIKALGVEAYWDVEFANKTELVDWGTIWPGASQNVTLYIRSISNTETTLILNSTNWNPSGISDYMNLVWNYSGTTLHPSETIRVTLTLNASSSSQFFLYLIANDVKNFSFDIIISTKEHL